MSKGHVRAFLATRCGPGRRESWPFLDMLERRGEPMSVEAATHLGKKPKWPAGGVFRPCHGCHKVPGVPGVFERLTDTPYDSLIHLLNCVQAQ